MSTSYMKLVEVEMSELDHEKCLELVSTMSDLLRNKQYVKALDLSNDGCASMVLTYEIFGTFVAIGTDLETCVDLGVFMPDDKCEMYLNTLVDNIQSSLIES